MTKAERELRNKIVEFNAMITKAKKEIFNFPKDGKLEDLVDLCNGLVWTINVATGMQEAYVALVEAVLDCQHPGCACVCGHEKKCPEDGPSIV